MVVLYIRSRLRKEIQRVTYAPVEERDRKRIEYSSIRIYKDDVTCTKI